MYCTNCGKEVKEYDNFCRFCGHDLRCETQDVKPVEKKISEPVKTNPQPVNDDCEELVLYEAEKHWRALVVPVFLTPLFFLYFWNIFLNTHSFLSWVVMLALLVLIIYPIVRYKSDKFVVTNKFVHIKVGVLNPEETDIPLEDISSVKVLQSSTGRIFDYGRVEFSYVNSSADYGHIKAPEDLQYIIDNPARFVKEALEEEVTV